LGTLGDKVALLDDNSQALRKGWKSLKTNRKGEKAQPLAFQKGSSVQGKSVKAPTHRHPRSANHALDRSKEKERARKKDPPEPHLKRRVRLGKGAKNLGKRELIKSSPAVLYERGK